MPWKAAPVVTKTRTVRRRPAAKKVVVDGGGRGARVSRITTTVPCVSMTKTEAAAAPLPALSPPSLRVEAEAAASAAAAVVVAIPRSRTTTGKIRGGSGRGGGAPRPMVNGRVMLAQQVAGRTGDVILLVTSEIKVWVSLGGDGRPQRSMELEGCCFVFMRRGSTGLHAGRALYLFYDLSLINKNKQ